MSLIKSLGTSSGGLRLLLKQCTQELFGTTQTSFEQRWQVNDNPGKLADKGVGTGRPYHQPTAAALFGQWQRSRDPQWLYTHPEYMWDAIGCSIYESCVAVDIGIKLMKDANIQPKRIYDWGAGPGFTTLMLAKAFPNAEVHYNEFNPPNAPKELESIFGWFSNKLGIQNASHVASPTGQYDLVVAMEIVEHFVHPSKSKVGDPMTHLDALVGGHVTSGGHVLYHSCWSAEANGWVTLGHFERYDIDGAVVTNKQASRAFHQALDRRKWKLVGRGWSARPRLYQVP